MFIVRLAQKGAKLISDCRLTQDWERLVERIIFADYAFSDIPTNETLAS
jgi:hypothetical protein